MKEGAWDLNTAQIWAVALTDLGMNEQLFLSAYRQSLSLEWLPTTPHDFFELSKHDFNFPDVRYAFEKAVDLSTRLGKKDFEHMAIYEAYSRIGSYALQREHENILWAKWQETYAKVCDEIIKGAVFQIPPEPAIEYIEIPADNAIAKNYLQDMLDKLNGKVA